MGWLDSLPEFVSGLSSVTQAVTPVAQLGLSAYSTYQGMQSADDASDYYDQLAGTAELQDTIALENLNRNRPVLDAEAQAALSDVQRYLNPEAVWLRGQTDLNTASSAYDASVYGRESARLSGQASVWDALAAQDAAYINSGLTGIAGQYLPGLTDSSFRIQNVVNDQSLQNAQTLMPMQRDVDVGTLQNAQSQNAINSVLLGSAARYLPGISDQQYALQGASLNAAMANMADYEATRSLQQKFMRESENGLDPSLAMSRAGAGVEHAMAAAGQELTRDAARRGVSVSSGQAQETARQNMIDTALGKAAARTKAWNDTEATNYARLGNAVNVRGGMAPANTGSTTQPTTVQSSVSSGINASLPTGFSGSLLSTGGINLPSTTTATAPQSGLTSSSSGGSGAWSSLAEAASDSASSALQAGGYLLGSVLGGNSTQSSSKK